MANTGGSSYYSPAQSPNPYSPSMNAPSPRGRGGAVAGTGARRGGGPSSVHNSPAPGSPQVLPSTYSSISATGNTSTFSGSSASTFTTSSTSVLPQSGISTPKPAAGTSYAYPTASSSMGQQSYSSTSTASPFPTAASNFVYTPPAYTTSYSTPNTSGLISLSGAPIVPAGAPPPSARVPGAVVDEDGEGDDELLPAMADDDYSAQLSWQSQSKDNLKVLMDNFTPLQYERFEAYRRHALPKQAVRKVIQQTLNMQVSLPVAQIVAGFSKVFVGEIVEKARAVQARRGESGPLSPDHLREAYRMYQEETGRVGAARPLRAKKLFVK